MKIIINILPRLINFLSQKLRINRGYLISSTKKIDPRVAVFSLQTILVT